MEIPGPGGGATGATGAVPATGDVATTEDAAAGDQGCSDAIVEAAGCGDIIDVLRAPGHLSTMRKQLLAFQDDY